MARGDYPSSKQPQFVLRFPDGMRDRIKAAADENGRSMNAEIVSRLEGSFSGDDSVATYLRDLLSEQARISQQATDLYGRAMDVAMHYKDLLVVARNQLRQGLTQIETLASYILAIDGPPSKEMCETADSIRKAARAANDYFSENSQRAELLLDDEE